MENLRYNPIFTGVSEEDIDKMMICFDAKKKNFLEKQTVSVYGAKSQQVGILFRGSISLNRINIDGSLDMLEYMENTGIFGAAFTFFDHEDEFTVLCEKNCAVLFIEKRHIIKRCENACIYHSQVVENLLAVMAEKVMSLTEKVDILSHRSIRGKLLCYFRIQASKKNANKFHLPFSFLALSNFLCIDRSAMMRELKKMKEEGVISIQGKEVWLL